MRGTLIKTALLEFQKHQFTFYLCKPKEHDNETTLIKEEKS